MCCYKAFTLTLHKELPFSVQIAIALVVIKKCLPSQARNTNKFLR